MIADTRTCIHIYIHPQASIHIQSIHRYICMYSRRRLPAAAAAAMQTAAPPDRRLGPRKRSLYPIYIFTHASAYMCHKIHIYNIYIYIYTYIYIFPALFQVPFCKCCLQGTSVEAGADGRRRSMSSSAVGRSSRRAVRQQEQPEHQG